MSSHKLDNTKRMADCLYNLPAAIKFPWSRQTAICDNVLYIRTLTQQQSIVSKIEVATIKMKQSAQIMLGPLQNIIRVTRASPKPQPNCLRDTYESEEPPRIGD